MAWNKAETKPFERVIIETSGVASPEPILDTLLREPWLSKRYRLHNVVATLAIPNALEQLHNFAEARAQLAWADQILLTQADLAAVGRTEEVYKQLQLIAPASPYRIVNWEFLTSAEILGVAVPVFRRLPTMQSLVEHDFRSLSLYLDHPPTWPKLHTILQDLLQRYTPGLVRIKGVVFVPDQEQPLAIHAVGGHLFPPTCLQFRTNDDRRIRLVFIADSNIDKLSNALPAALYGHEHSIRLH
jgi:G3E family GTPase